MLQQEVYTTSAKIEEDLLEIRQGAFSVQRQFRKQIADLERDNEVLEEEEKELIKLS